MIDAVLLELEHIVFDTRKIRETCLQDALAAHELASIPEEDNTLADLVALSATRSFVAKISSGGLTLQPGARGFIERAASHARLAVVTSMSRAELDTMLRMAELEDYFTVRVCADDVLNGKPSPDGHNLALDRFDRQRRVNLRSVVALESSAVGIRAARRAGARCVAVGAVPAYVAMEANAFIESVEGHTLASIDRLSRANVERVK